MIPLVEKDFYETISKLIVAKLDKASQSNDLVDITGIYGIGTTSSLVAFAKKHGYTVIVSSNDTAKKLRLTFSYPYIFSVQNLPDKNQTGLVVIDAGIERLYIEQQGLKVKTGYYRKERRFM